MRNSLKANIVKTKVEEFYLRNVRYFDHMLTSHDEIYFEPMFRAIEESGFDLNNKTILDVGCGSGSLGRILKNSFNKVKVDGVDIIKNKKKYHAVYDKYFVQDAENLNLPKSKYDVVFLSDVLEHFAFPMDAIRGANKVLKKGGILVIRTQNYQSPISMKYGWKNSLMGLTAIFDPGRDLNEARILDPILTDEVLGGDQDAISMVTFSQMRFSLKAIGMKLLVAKTWTKSHFIFQMLNSFFLTSGLGSKSLLVAQK